MIIEKFTGKYDCLIHTISFEKLDCVLDKEIKIKKGWEYYAFITPDKNWIRHSGKLTKEEKQLVIKQESK
jgi:predicted DNA binding protein